MGFDSRADRDDMGGGEGLRAKVATAVALFRSKPAFGFSDCLILELARKAGHLPFGTFDRNLSRVPGIQKI